MLYLYPSNKTESLAVVLAKLQSSPPLEDPFESEVILTQSYGMGVWLRQQISLAEGIACMEETIMPGAFLWKLVEKLVPNTTDGEQNAFTVQNFEKNTLRWEIFKRLQTLIEEQDFVSVKNYLDSLRLRAGQADAEASLFKISELMADNFDAYQNYRSDWIAAWEKDEPLSDLSGLNTSFVQSDEPWQRALWLSLYPELDRSERSHRASQIQRLLRVLQQGSFDKSVLPQRVFVFGMAAIPVQWLPVFLALGRHIDVHFLFQNPCRYYWGDVLTERQQLLQKKRRSDSSDYLIGSLGLIEENSAADSSPDELPALGQADLFESSNAAPADLIGSSEQVSSTPENTDSQSTLFGHDSHPLLASLGELGKSYLGALYAYDESDGLSEFDANLFSESGVTDEARGDENSLSILGHIQNDLLRGELSNAQLAFHDNSLRFARCHSKLREVESLKDYLLDLLDADANLEPRHIIVMAPNIQDYSALVDAVFGAPLKSHDGSYQRLPYGLSDQAVGHEHPIVEQLLAVLQFRKGRLTLDEIFSLLELEAVAARFGLNSDQLAYARRLCEELNIRWGLNEAHRDSVTGGQKTGAQNTWLSGLNRALRSYVLGSPSDLDNGFLEFPIRSAGSHEVLGKLIGALDLVQYSIDLLNGKSAVQNWVAHIEYLWNAWFDMNALDESLSRLMDQVLDGLREQIVLSRFEDEVSFELVFGCVRSALESEKVSQRFLAGRINFCNLMPMRTVPFKVVCLLGMNEGAYPRPNTSQSFDLLEQLPKRRGDRSRRNDDRYMFLEALLSAEEHFYISYKGYNPKDNTELFPSVLVAELQDICVRCFSDSSKAQKSQLLDVLTFEHRLQAFHRIYFSDRPEVFGKHESGRESIGSNTKHVPVLQGVLPPKSFSSDWYALHDASTNNTQPLTDHSSAQAFAVSSGAQTSEQANDASQEVLALAEWERAFAHPMAYFYESQIGLSSSRVRMDVTDSEEPFELDGLDKFQLVQSLCDVWFHGGSREQLIKGLELSGFLPQEPVGEWSITDVETENVNFKEAIAELAEHVSPMQIEIPAPQALRSSERKVSTITGIVYTSPQGLVDVHFSKNPSRWFFGAWARHVLWNVFLLKSGRAAIDIPATSVCLTPQWRIEFPTLSSDDAFEFLEQLCLEYPSFQSAPRSFLPDPAFRWLSGKDKTPEGAFTRACWRDSEYKLWRRYCLLSEQQKDPSSVPDLEVEVTLRQAQRYSARFNETLDKSEGIQIKEIKK